MLMKRAVLMEQWAQFCRDESPQLPNLDELAQKRVA